MWAMFYVIWHAFRKEPLAAADDMARIFSPEYYNFHDRSFIKWIEQNIVYQGAVNGRNEFAVIFSVIFKC